MDGHGTVLLSILRTELGGRGREWGGGWRGGERVGDNFCIPSNHSRDKKKRTRIQMRSTPLYFCREHDCIEEEEVNWSTNQPVRRRRRRRGKSEEEEKDESGGRRRKKRKKKESGRRN